MVVSDPSSAVTLFSWAGSPSVQREGDGMGTGWRNLMILFTVAIVLSIGTMMTVEPRSSDGFWSGADSSGSAVLTSTSVSVPSPAPQTVVLFIGDDRIGFTDDVACALGPDLRGTIEARTAEGTSLSVLLADPVSAVMVDGPPGSFTALITSVDQFEQALSLSADPPGVEVVVALAVCADPA